MSLLSLLVEYKYGLLFPLLVLEGPAASIAASFLASPGGGMLFNVWAVLAVIIIADVFGDVMYYSMGRWGKNRMVARYPKPFSLAPARFERIDEYFKKHGLKTLAVGKVSHSFGWPTMVVAGSAKVPFQKFITISFLVSIIKSPLFVALGYYFGTHYEEILQYIGRIGLIISGLIVVVIIYFILRHRRS